VKDKSDLLWFSDLLNRIISADTELAARGDLDLNIHTHITTKRKNISTHVFRYVLDSYRTEKAPYSALTGLKQPSHFGRPDFAAILKDHMDQLLEMGVNKKKVGVFFCGVPVVGEIIANQCHENTVRGRELDVDLEYVFNMEVFG
jgi:respiratory burst oxidase